MSLPFFSFAFFFSFYWFVPERPSAGDGLGWLGLPGKVAAAEGACVPTPIVIFESKYVCSI